MRLLVKCQNTKEIKTDINSQILQAIDSAITEKVNTFLNNLGLQKSGFVTKVERLSMGYTGFPKSKFDGF